MSRGYLDWNATAPLRPEARAAMLQAMDVVGNPSSVHAEGRAAKAIVEKARGQVARLVGCEPSEVVFTSGATEGAATVCCVSYAKYAYSPADHDCLFSQVLNGRHNLELRIDRNGKNSATDEILKDYDAPDIASVLFWTSANGESGIIEPNYPPSTLSTTDVLCDSVQVFGKVPFTTSDQGGDFTLISAHKFGGPKGIGAIVLASGREIRNPVRGGGQEMGRRSGTENVIGIAGFGAAAEAAQRDLEDGVWEHVEKLRDNLEEALASAAKDTIFVGKDVPRLPNTSCFATPGWKGETQVMQMDLAGYAVSAGSACSSGKVKESRVLRAMGFDAVTASSAIRVSIGPTTTEAEVMGFAGVWTEHFRRWKDRRAA